MFSIILFCLRGLSDLLVFFSIASQVRHAATGILVLSLH